VHVIQPCKEQGIIRWYRKDQVYRQIVAQANKQYWLFIRPLIPDFHYLVCNAEKHLKQFRIKLDARLFPHEANSLIKGPGFFIGPDGKQRVKDITDSRNSTFGGCSEFRVTGIV
jgi:hypothetical protein